MLCQTWRVEAKGGEAKSAAREGRAGFALPVSGNFRIVHASISNIKNCGPDLQVERKLAKRDCALLLV